MDRKHYTVNPVGACRGPLPFILNVTHNPPWFLQSGCFSTFTCILLAVRTYKCCHTPSCVCSKSVHVAAHVRQWPFTLRTGGVSASSSFSILPHLYPNFSMQAPFPTLYEYLLLYIIFWPKLLSWLIAHLTIIMTQQIRTQTCVRHTWAHSGDSKNRAFEHTGTQQTVRALNLIYFCGLCVCVCVPYTCLPTTSFAEAQAPSHA